MRTIQVLVAVAAAAAMFISPPAQAHFILQAPDSWAQQSSLGDPQKSAPCGQADPGLAAVPTNDVTPFSPGETITITINETISHPGHYRVALSTSGQGGLPYDPLVTPVGNDPCGSTVVQNPPVFPVLADGQLVHTSAFSGPQSFQVTLPSDVTCTNCTLQVVEYMSSHGAPCFYHHCATISIQGGNDAGSVEPTDSGSGCACAVGQQRVPPIAAGVLLALFVVSMRRRRF
jgi:MYXO-CTERM domain-containing protein